MTVEVIQMSRRAIVTSLNDIGKNIYRDLVSEMIKYSNNIFSWLRLQIVLSGPEKEVSTVRYTKLLLAYIR